MVFAWPGGEELPSDVRAQGNPDSEQRRMTPREVVMRKTVFVFACVMLVAGVAGAVYLDITGGVSRQCALVHQ